MQVGFRRVELEVEQLGSPTYATQGVLDFMREVAQGFPLGGEFVAELAMPVEQQVMFEHAHLKKRGPGLTEQGHQRQSHRQLLATPLDFQVLAQDAEFTLEGIGQSFLQGAVVGKQLVYRPPCQQLARNAEQFFGSGVCVKHHPLCVEQQDRRGEKIKVGCIHDTPEAGSGRARGPGLTAAY